MSFFIWLEGSAVSTWIRETPSVLAFPFILYLHTLGLALIAGLSSAVALAIITLPGLTHRLPLARLFPLMWIGLAINALSGLALLVAYPAKALTNPVFYIKLVAIGIACGIVLWLERQLLASAGADAHAAMSAGMSPGIAAGTSPGIAAGTDISTAATASDPLLRLAAWSLLGLWLIATLTGRMLAYTHSILLATYGF